MMHFFEITGTAESLYISLATLYKYETWLNSRTKMETTNTELSRAKQLCYEAENVYIYAWLPHTSIAADVK